MKSNQGRNGNAKVLRLAVASVFALVGATGGSAYAEGQKTANLAVTATVPTNCLISVAAMGFGNYDPIQANTGSNHLDNSSGKVTVTCTKGSAPVITLDQGLNADGGTADAPNRRMAKGGEFLNYTLYRDPARTQVWGDTTGSGYAVPSPGGAGAAQEISIHGRITGNQNVSAGEYTDTVVAKVTF
jgi:spore coat protein U-like protein